MHKPRQIHPMMYGVQSVYPYNVIPPKEGCQDEIEDVPLSIPYHHVRFRIFCLLDSVSFLQELQISIISPISRWLHQPLFPDRSDGKIVDIIFEREWQHIIAIVSYNSNHTDQRIIEHLPLASTTYH